MRYSYEISKGLERELDKLQKKNKKRFEIILKKMSEILNELKFRQKIMNWTAGHGKIGEDFEAVFDPLQDAVGIYLPNKMKSIVVVRTDFRFVYDKWNEYIEGNINRSGFNEIYTSKSVISIIHSISNRFLLNFTPLSSSA